MGERTKSRKKMGFRSHGVLLSCPVLFSAKLAKKAHFSLFQPIRSNVVCRYDKNVSGGLVEGENNEKCRNATVRGALVGGKTTQAGGWRSAITIPINFFSARRVTLFRRTRCTVFYDKPCAEK